MLQYSWRQVLQCRVLAEEIQVELALIVVPYDSDDWINVGNTHSFMK
jgi:hypothetical protein